MAQLVLASCWCDTINTIGIITIILSILLLILVLFGGRALAPSWTGIWIFSLVTTSIGAGSIVVCGKKSSPQTRLFDSHCMGAVAILQRHAFGACRTDTEKRQNRNSTAGIAGESHGVQQAV